MRAKTWIRISGALAGAVVALSLGCAGTSWEGARSEDTVAGYHRFLRDNPQSGLSGPFIHSAPKGNMFRGPFRERAWMIGKQTVLKKAWTPESGWQFYRSDEGVV